MIDIELQRARSAMAESVTLPIATWLEALDELGALRQTRLVQQAEQEPVAWALSHSMGLEFGSKYPIQETKEAAEQMARQHMGAVVVTPLYAAPARTKDLTDDEIEKAVENILFDENFDINIARAVIAADRAKNNLCERTK